MLLVLCGELEEDLRAMVGWFVKVCRRIGLKVNDSKSKVMVMNGEEGLEYDVHVGATFLLYSAPSILVSSQNTLQIF